MSFSLEGYEKLEKVAAGNEIVYRGERIRDRHPVAIAILPEQHLSPTEFTQFRNQYIITQNLDVADVVKIYDLESFDDGYALVMEDFNGISWLDYVAAIDPLVSCKEQLLDFLEIAIAVVEILAKLQENQIVHQKIQPRNILIHPHTKQVKLKDFSLAALLPKNRQLSQSLSFGGELLPYISPEQTGRIDQRSQITPPFHRRVIRDCGIDHRTDFYSLGVTFYQILTGELPFSKTNPIELYAHLASEPISPSRVNSRIPLAVSQIVLKLMAKNPESRYQTALGLKYDLEECRQQWQQHEITTFNFNLGTRDTCDRLIISERLYGREEEVATLLKAYDRVSLGNREIAIVFGHAGIGKTALIENVGQTILRRRGRFLKGKFAQFMGDRPLAAIAEALQSLILQLQTETPERLGQWRQRLLRALGDNGRIVIDVIPELEAIVGKQPPVTQLEPSAAINRFNLVLKNFIRVFATAEHPLVIFLDDLQWADLASLKFIRLLMGDRDLSHLLLIGAYRDNEVSSAHPLTIELAEIERELSRCESATVSRIALSPLNRLTLNTMIADSLYCSEALAFPLTETLWQKTRGNPFFTIELLHFLHQEGLITFNRSQNFWQCDIARVKILAVSDDVVEFMARRLKQLSSRTQHLLKLAACIGNEFDLNTLAIAMGQSELDTATELCQALREGLILPISEIHQFALNTPFTAKDVSGVIPYQFLHDRVHQAAYGLLSATEKISTHWQIGQSLLERTPIALREEKIFAIVNHLNLAVELMPSRAQREHLAELNLTAGNKAKAANAYQPAWSYFSRGLKLLTSDCWETKYELTLSLSVAAAEAAYLCGNLEQMERLVGGILHHGRSLLDRVKAYEVKIYAYIARGEPLEAVKVAILVLELLGVRFSLKSSKIKLLWALVRMKSLLAGKEIADLSNLPKMSDPYLLAVMKIMGIVGSPAYNATPDLVPLLALKAVNLSLEHGNTALSIYAYASYGVALCGSLGQLDRGYQFGKLALNLLAKLNAKELKAKTLMVFNNFIRHWQEHPQSGLESLRDAYCSGLETGDLEFASYAAFVYSYHSYLIGKELNQLEREVFKYSEFISQIKQETALNLVKLYRQVILNLMGHGDDPTCLQGESYDENLTLPSLLAANHLSAICHLYCHKLILCYLFKSYAEAIFYADKTAQYLSGVKATLIFAFYHFYDSLTRLAIYDRASYLEQKLIIKKVKANQKKLKTWAESAPMNYRHKYYLVEAEKQRVLGKYLQAIDSYEKAIDSAKINKYFNDLALAQELTGRFYFTWDKKDIARLYLTDAYYSYVRWGAMAKAKDLVRDYARLLEPTFKTTNLTNISTSITNKDLVSRTIINATRAISKEIELDKLLKTLLEAIIKTSGAQTGVLILLDDEAKDFLAAVTVANNFTQIEFDLDKIEAIEQNLPDSIINYVKSTLKPIVLNKAIENTIFATDIYFINNNPRSLLCLPILERQKLLGIVYLENNSASNIFTRDRLEILDIFCAQAAISLTNAKLYTNLQHSENREKQKAKQLEKSLVQLQQSQQKLLKVQQQLKHDAFHDSLTDLPNRSLLITLLKKSIELATRHPTEYLYAFLFLDLDGFKAINDSSGHLAGDELLKQVAQRLLICVRASDTVSRLGGDEFGILLEKLEATTEATAVACRIQEQFVRPFYLNNRKIHVGTSIGITFGTLNYRRPEEILRDADTAMYRAKSQGKGQYFIFDNTKNR